jgi:GxxExxY protein
MTARPFTETDPEIEDLVHKVIGAAIEVHKALGPGHLEKHYEEALCHELDLLGVPYERQKRVTLLYKGKVIGEGKVDLLVMKRLVVELKAQENVSEVQFAVAKSYLRILDQPLGLMLNFHVAAMNDKKAIRRVIAGLR